MDDLLYLLNIKNILRKSQLRSLRFFCPWSHNVIQKSFFFFFSQIAEESHRTTWGWVNDNIKFIFGQATPFKGRVRWKKKKKKVEKGKKWKLNKYMGSEWLFMFGWTFALKVDYLLMMFVLSRCPFTKKIYINGQQSHYFTHYFCVCFVGEVVSQHSWADCWAAVWGDQANCHRVCRKGEHSENSTERLRNSPFLSTLITMAYWWNTIHDFCTDFCSVLQSGGVDASVQKS